MDTSVDVGMDTDAGVRACAFETDSGCDIYRQTGCAAGEALVGREVPGTGVGGVPCQPTANGPDVRPLASDRVPKGVRALRKEQSAVETNNAALARRYS